MLAAGFSLRQALEFSGLIMTKQAPVINQVSNSLASGQSLATALRPWLPADLYYQLQLAEHHGSLNQALAELSTYLELREKERAKLRSLLQYPLLLLAMLGGLGGLLRLYVYPELSSWQARASPGWWAAIKPVLLATVSALVTLGLLRYLAWRRQSRLGQVNALCRLPVVGRLMRLYFGYYLTSNLAILVGRGLSLKAICALLGKYEPASLLYQLGSLVADRGDGGQDLAHLVHSQPCLPNELVAILCRGLTSQQLGEELAVFARLQFQHLTRRTESLLVLVQPVLFLIIALGILGMYLSLLLPIYQSMTVVN